MHIFITLGGWNLPAVPCQPTLRLPVLASGGGLIQVSKLSCDGSKPNPIGSMGLPGIFAKPYMNG